MKLALRAPPFFAGPPAPTRIPNLSALVRKYGDVYGERDGLEFAPIRVFRGRPSAELL